MKTLAELRTQLGELDSKRKAFDESHKDKAMTAEERTEFKALLDQIDAVIEEIDLAERSEKIAAAASAPVASTAGLKIHNVADEAKYSFGEFLREVAFATRSQMREVAPRLAMHQKRNSVQSAASGMNEGLPADGGFLVGTDFAAGLIERVYDNSLVARCTRTPISAASNTLKLNGIDETSRANGSRYGGVVGYWVEEAGTLTAAKPKFRQITLTLKKQACLAYVTDEQLADAPALESTVTQAVTGEMAFQLQDALINGNGAGKLLGILQSPCLVTVTKETGQAADTVVLENISKMWARMWAPSRLNSVWLINQEVEPQLDTLVIPVGTGGMPAYMPPGGLADAPYGRLKGRPVIAIEQCQALGDAGDIVLADFSQYQLIDKGGIQSASSMHVLFLTDEMTFRFIYRVDGQPLWNSALTPYKGSGTLSPFVTLGARA